ncbi:hypothetical protein [Brevundimonas sp.]|uniref:hypothetical protein n=1 Tax=Brevundimonas sp. TaxID=1871086 RepID=UPI0035AE128E
MYPSTTYYSPAETPDQPVLDRIADRVRGLVNILANANDSHDLTVSRLFTDGSKPASGNLAAVPPQMPGAVGAVHAALDALEAEVSRASGFAGDFSRL